MGADLSAISDEPSAPPAPAIEATYKAREVEGIVDLYFYRRIGFRVAQFFARLNATPTAVTLIGGVFGIVAGHLYFYQSLLINLIGMAFHVVANVFDNADGQLARLTNQRTRIGRILDPVVDHMVFVSIYFHLALRLQAGHFSAAIWLLALAAGISHGLQAAAADYCRNAYLYFAKGRNEFDTAATLTNEHRSYGWMRDWWVKVLLSMYLGVMREQEFLLPGTKRLHDKVMRDYANQVPGWLQTQYCDLARPTFKWFGVLMTNTRMLVLFVLFLIRQPICFFWLELTVGNLLLLYLVIRQERVTRFLMSRLSGQPQAG